jgi:hypothetical protein
LPLPAAVVEEQSACFVVRDHNGQALAYVYFADEPGRRLTMSSLTQSLAVRGCCWAIVSWHWLMRPERKRVNFDLAEGLFQ